MASVGSVKLDKRLLAIKPKYVRVRLESKRSLLKKHGFSVEGSHRKGKLWHTITITPTTPKEAIAHEFAHAALGHRSSANRTAGQQVMRELRAGQWVREHWAGKHSPIKVGIGDIVFDIMFQYELPKEVMLPIIKHQMRLAKMKPLTPQESKWLVARFKRDEIYLRGKGWEPREVRQR